MSQRITIVRGNDERFQVTIKAGGLPVNLSGVTVRSEVKDAPGAAGHLLFEAEVSVVSPESGVIQLRFPNDKTAMLQPNTVVFFDLMLVFPDGSVKNIPNPPFSALVVDRVTD